MSDLKPYKKNNVIDKSVEDFYNLVDNFFNDSFPKDFNKKLGFKLDVSETDNDYIVDADLPGFTKDEVNVSFDNGKLIISANKNEEKDNFQDKDKNVIHKERKVESVERILYFDNVDEDNINAKLNNGVLEITIPKLKKTASTKNIAID